MAFEEALRTITLPVAADLSGNQFYLVEVDSAGRAALATAAVTANPIGVLQNKPAAVDEEGTIVVQGVTKLVAGEVITAGDLISPDATAGRAGVAGTSADTILGRAISSAGDGELFSCFIGGMHGGEVA